MEKERIKKEAVELLYRRYKTLFAGSALSDEEKQDLSNEILNIIFGSSDEVVNG